jgi:hypothetical protein
MHKLAAGFLGLLAAGLIPLLSGKEAPAVQTEVTHTETVSFAPGGTIRFNHSFGDLYVAGWDRPEVEITVVKSLQQGGLSVVPLPDYKPPEDAAKLLDAVRIATEHSSANELTIGTTIPSHHFFAHPFGGKGPVTVRCELHVPRDSRLIVHHGGGFILVENVTGGVEATNRDGDIVLMLPGPGPYAIDARSKVGTVTSDFEGKAHGNHLLGEKYASASSDSSRRIFLRVGFGGITVKDAPSESFQ